MSVPTLDPYVPLEERPITRPSIPGVEAKFTRIMVIVRPNIDCDGYGEGYHKVAMRIADVEAFQAGILDEHTLIRRCILDDAAGFSGDASECWLLTAGEFYRAHWDGMNTWSRMYFQRENYYSWFNSRYS